MENFEFLTSENFEDWLKSNKLKFKKEKIEIVWEILEDDFGEEITKESIKLSDLDKFNIPKAIKNYLKKWSEIENENFTQNVTTTNANKDNDKNNNDTKLDSCKKPETSIQWIYPKNKQNTTELKMTKEVHLIRDIYPPQLIENERKPFPKVIHIPPNVSSFKILIKGKENKSELIEGNEANVNSKGEAEFINFKLLKTSYNEEEKKYEGWIFIFNLYNENNEIIKRIETKPIQVFSHLNQLTESNIDKLIPSARKSKKNHNSRITQENNGKEEMEEMEEEKPNPIQKREEEYPYPLEFVENYRKTDISKLTNFRDYAGYTLLHWSSGLGDEKMTKYCLENGFDINDEDYYGCTPLYWAIWNENESMASLLLSYKDKLKLDINLGNDYGTTPLHLAYYFENKSLIELLIQNGASNEIEDIYGNIPHIQIPKMNTNDLEIYDRKNDDQKNLEQHVGKFVISLNKKNVYQIKFKGGKFGEEDCKHLIEIFQKYNREQELNLEDCKIGKEGCKHLSEALKEQQFLTAIFLDNNNIENEGIKHLSQALEKNSLLQILNLTDNNIGAQGCKYLSEALKQNSSLQALNLRKNNIKDEGCKYLSEALKNKFLLKRLYLYWNNIGVEGCKYLGEALKTNTSLQQLDFGRNIFGDEGCKYLSEALNKNNSLQKLILERNNIGDEGCKYLSEVLKTNTSLLELALENNNVKNRGVFYLYESLRNNSALKILNLKGNPIGDEGAILLSSCFQFNRTLSTLDLCETHLSVISKIFFFAIQQTFPQNSGLNLKFISDFTEETKFLKKYENQIVKIKSIVSQVEGGNEIDFKEFNISAKLLIYFLSILYDNSKVFEYFIEREMIDINAISELGNTCLHFSCMNGYYGSTKKLLNYGANPSIINKLGKTCKDVSIGECKTLFAVLKILKVVIVGKQRVGKTTLVKRIFNKELGNSSETDGIEMHEWKPHNDESLGIIQLWDFAGQDLFYTTHQFFLSENSITLLLFNLTENIKETKLEFWLNSIQYRAPKSKVFIIGTFFDRLNIKSAEQEIQKKAEEVKKIISKVTGNNQRLQLDSEKLKIIECKEWKVDSKLINKSIPFWCISGIQNIGIDKVINQLINLSISENVRSGIKALGDEIIEKRKSNIKKEEQNTKDILSKLKEEEKKKIKDVPCMSISELENLIEKHFGTDISKEDKCKIIQELHELGFILDYSKWKLNQIIYDPQRLADLFRCIVSLKTKENIKEGLIEKQAIRSNLKTEFPNITKDEVQFLLHLLQQFEIFIPHPLNKDLLLIPFLLNEEIPPQIKKDWNNFEESYQNKLGRGYVFPFLPCGFIAKLIYGINNSKLKYLSFVYRVWKNGVLLALKKANILIEFIESSSSLTLSSKIEPPLQKEELEEKHIIKILSLGENYLDNLEQVEFILLEVLEKEYSLLVQTMNRVIYYYNKKVEYVLSYWNCLDTFKKAKDKVIDDRFSVSYGALFFDKSDTNDSITKAFETETLIEGNKLDSGASGDVYKCRFKNIPGVFAIKVCKVDPKNNDEKSIKILESFQNEKKILESIGNHPHLVSLKACRSVPLSLIFEYYDSSLQSILSSPKKFANIEKIEMCFQICKGLNFLHSRCIVHLDIKPHNILVESQRTGNKEKKHLRIGDFGTSKQLLHANETITIAKGTRKYMAPEAKKCFSNPVPYNPFFADIYSFGVLMADIQFGYNEKGTFNLNELRNCQDQADYVIFSRIICCCNEVNPNARPSSSELNDYFKDKMQDNN